MADTRAVTLLRITCVGTLAAVFLLAGVQKLTAGDAGVTLLSRYVDSARAVQALGVFEIGLAAWLLSFRTPRLSAGVVIVVLLGFSVVIGLELRREQPLPCGCLRVTPGATSPHEVRRGLWISLGRNATLILLGAMNVILALPAGGVSRLQSVNQQEKLRDEQHDPRLRR